MIQKTSNLLKTILKEVKKSQHVYTVLLSTLFVHTCTLSVQFSVLIQQLMYHDSQWCYYKTTILSAPQVKLSNPSDGLIHIGDAICLMHMPTQSVISAYMSAAQSHEARQLISNCNVASSKRLQPCPRNIFIVGRYSTAYSRVHVHLGCSVLKRMSVGFSLQHVARICV